MPIAFLYTTESKKYNFEKNVKEILDTILESIIFSLQFRKEHERKLLVTA